MPVASSAAHPPATHCAIDFGTSNSGIALPQPGGGVHLVELEPGYRTMPTAVFYAVDDHEAGPEFVRTLAPGDDPWPPAPRAYGRAAVAAYVDGLDGRLMRSMKSVLGSSLIEQSTDVGGGRSVRYLDVIAGYLQHLKRLAESQAGAPLQRVVLGRPVYFVDGEPARDAAAQAALETAARSVGFSEIAFQFEPIAAALDFEQHAERELKVLVADIGGGTSDFSIVRVGPQRRGRLDRRDDILANHGVHVAGTDFDRRVELEAILPTCGFRALGPARPGEAAREVPSKVYFDLATWHLINTVYAPQRVAELARMRSFYADALLHERLMRVITQRLGHALAAQAEAAKIAVADGGATAITLEQVEPGLAVPFDAREAGEAVEADLQRIVDAAAETLRLAGLQPAQVDVLYFTGGSTGLKPLTERLAAVVPQAEARRGDRFASVAQGLGLHAQRLFG
jgi:hypothetical chaperone protein